MKRIIYIVLITISLIPAKLFARGMSLSQGENPKIKGVATDKLGNLYVVDVGRNAIWKYSADGKKLDPVQLPPDASALDGAICVEADKIYFSAADKNGGRDVLWQADPRDQSFIPLVNVWGKITGIAVERNNVYFSEANGGTISRLDCTNAERPVQFTVATGLQTPQGVAVSKEGVVFCTTSFDKSVWRATPVETSRIGGNYKLEPIVESGIKEPRGIAIDDRGYLYVADEDSRLHRYNSNGGEHLVSQLAPCEDNNLLRPIAVAVHRSTQTFQYHDPNDVYVVANNKVLYFNNSLIKDVQYSRTKVKLFSATSAFTGVIVDKSGNFYVGCKGGGILKNGSDIGAIAPNHHVTSLIMDNNDNIYFNATDGWTWKAVLNPYTKEYDLIKVANFGGYGAGIALDAQGNIYVLNSSTGTLVKFGPDGRDLTEILDGIPQGAGLSVDSDGTIYISSGLTKGKIWRARPVVGTAKYSIVDKELFDKYLGGVAVSTLGLANDGRFLYATTMRFENGRVDSGVVMRFPANGQQFDGEIAQYTTLYLNTSADPLSTANSVTVDGMGNAYVLTYKSRMTQTPAVWKIATWRVLVTL